MTYLTDKEEQLLDSNRIIDIERGNCTFHISPMDIIAYGAIDFTDGSDDMIRMEDFKILDHLIERGMAMPASYDYETHSCLSPTSKPQHYDTTCPEKYLQYVHGFLGKPKITVIFKIKK